MPIKILALSDIEISFINSPVVRERFRGINLIISCGDLPLDYLEYVHCALDVPLYFVRGNHCPPEEHSPGGCHIQPHGGINLHGDTANHNGLLLAGVEGSLRYHPGPHQYTQGEMWMQVLKLAPRLLQNRSKHGRYLDIFITHAPPKGVHDENDLAHQGIKAFRWLIHVFRPQIHLHGHVHLYRPDTVRQTQIEQTKVINAYGYREVEIELPSGNTPDRPSRK